MMVVFASCTPDENPVPDIEVKDIELTSTSTSTSIELSWKPVEGCSWYFISITEEGETADEETSYQDLQNDPITYNLTGLTASTSYEIKMVGSDYLSGGKILATKTLKVTTDAE